LADCVNVLVISDTELICSMQLTRRLDPDGTFLASPTARTVTDGVTTGTTGLTSATANFTSADVGLVLSVASDTEVPIGTTIVSVTNPTTVVLSATTVAGTAIATTIGAPRAVTTIGTTNLSTTITGAAGKFKPSDVGRPIVGAAGLAAGLGATIVAVNSDGSSATLSRPATATGTTTMTISAAVPIADGAYTLTFVTNGALDAAANDPDYSQSIITSGSTFTVADY
jgi:hypothetical protein